MAISLDPATKLISVPQADLTLVSGTLYSLDTNQFRNDVMALLASESYIWMDDAFQHNTEVTVAGTTFARTIEFINGYSIKFEDTGGQYSVRLEGSNNNIFDVENGILTPTSLVTIISTNSAGLIKNEAQSIGQADLDNIADAVWDETLAGHTTAGTAGKSQSDTETTTTTIDGKVDIIDTNVDTINTNVAALPSAADNADAVWDEQIDDHLTAGTTGAWLKNKVLTVAKYLGLS